jgi:amidophosphoribosyltransferase
MTNKVSFLTSEDKEPIQDHCGIVAIFSPKDKPFLILGLAGLFQLQTRGYDGAGFWTISTQGEAVSYRGQGMISEVFSREVVGRYKNLLAKIWLFQTRYGTTSKFNHDNVQPISAVHLSSKEPFAVVHNGQFSQELGDDWEEMSDTRIFVQQLAESQEASWEKRLIAWQKRKKGAWSLVVGTKDALYLMRDPFGIRPLSFGEKGDIFFVASEVTALNKMGVARVKEVLPNSVMKISSSGVELLYQGKPFWAPCIFENVYFKDGSSKIHEPRSRPEEINDSLTVEDVRRRCGINLAKEAPLSAEQADFVIGVPGTGIAGGEAYAQALGIPYIQAITDRNPQDDPRTFMTAQIEAIYRKVLDHFYFDRAVLEGMRVVLVDDSLVRGNISTGLVGLLRSAYKVKEVHLRILCPPIDKGCYLGINTRTDKELIAARLRGDVEKIRKAVGADSLAYLSDKGLLAAMGKRRDFCLGCMLGHWPPLDKRGNLK